MEYYEVHPKLKEIFPIAQSIAETFENMCEVVVHDFKYPEKSLVYIAGNLTGRKIGSPITNLALEKLKNNGDNSNNLIGYQTSSKDGKIFKSSTIFIRDENGKIIGCMCLNIDITQFLTCKQILDNFTKLNTKNENITSSEEFYGDLNEALNSIIENVLNEYPVPKQLMGKEDKLIIVKKLDEKGVFLVKGAIDQIAAVLGVSRYTIYNYLEEVRSRPETESVF